MISKVYTISNLWIEGFLVTVETSSNKALPTIDIVWLADTSIKESKERIRSAFTHLNIKLPNRKFIVNLSPSNIKKSWNRYDLPIAVWILWLVLDNIDKNYLDNSIFAWELGLDGRLKFIEGVIPILIKWKEEWFKNFFIPKDNIEEARFIWWINIIAVDSLQEVIDIITNIKKPKYIENKKIEQTCDYDIDFQDIKWNLLQKRAVMISACWMHNMLMIWPPWSWKTMLAKAIKWILPPMDEDEVLETSMIYSIKWLLNKTNPIISSRPYRTVHHTSSSISIIWWWHYLHPWEISLANNGVLFFDEIAEFPRSVLEALRQPLEDKQISIARANWSISYPAKFMFISAMNPCKCWYYKDKEKQCTCTINEIKKYQSKISWPLLDRFDIILEVPRQNIDKILSNKKEKSSKELREDVIRTWNIQKERFKKEKINFNSQMDSKLIQKYCPLSKNVKDILKKASKNFSLSARAIHRIIKLSRTLADIEWKKNIEENNVLEALQYRSKSMFIEEQ